MTNSNMDEFDQEGFEQEEHSAGPTGMKQNLAEAWRTRPIFKLAVIMGVVGVALAGALGAFSGSASAPSSRLAAAPDLNEAPGGKSSPFFIEQNKQANDLRANKAIAQGGSALPTPVGQNIDLDDLTNKNKKDPLLEFKAETDRLKQEMKQEQQQNNQQIQLLQQQVMQRQQPEQEDDSLAKAMQHQMQQLMDGWAPRKIAVVGGVLSPQEREAEEARKAARENATKVSSEAAFKPDTSANDKTVVEAGTVNYGQLLVEANSDVQAPILAQVMSGPLAGARLVGRFQVMNDYLVLSFSLASLKGKDYSVDVIALDPSSTLAGLATEVDHRYLTRVLLPAAAAFLTSFGQTLGEASTTATQTDSAVLYTQAKRSSKDAMYEGLGQAGQTMGQFFQQQANQTKTLVRVAVGTPIGLFFLAPVKASGKADESIWSNMNMQARGQTGSYGATNGVNQLAYPGAAYGNMQQSGYGQYNQNSSGYYGQATGYNQGYGSNYNNGINNVYTSQRY